MCNLYKRHLIDVSDECIITPMRKSKSNSPGVNVSSTGKTSVASTMKPVFGRGKGRKSTRKGR